MPSYEFASVSAKPLAIRLLKLMEWSQQARWSGLCCAWDVLVV